jgi:nucleotide-binding universal stress UspA family protein
VAIDFSEASRCALDRSLEFFPNAAHILLHCYGSGIAETHDLAESECEKFLRLVCPQSKNQLDVVIEHCDVVQRINAIYADQGLDLLVIGAKGRTAAADLLLGGTANRLLNSARCDVLLVTKQSN